MRMSLLWAPHELEQVITGVQNICMKPVSSLPTHIHIKQQTKEFRFTKTIFVCLESVANDYYANMVNEAQL